MDDSDREINRQSCRHHDQMRRSMLIHRTSIRPTDVHGIAAFWDFQRPGFTCGTSGYQLRPGAKPPGIAAVPGAPFGEQALVLNQGDYLICLRAECPRLDFHGEHSTFTLVAWIRRRPSVTGECEFIGGMWDETRRKRQYGLFINNRIWDGEEKLCGHVSASGGPSAGFKYCFDAAMGETVIQHHQWMCVALSFDGQAARVWVDGRLDGFSSLNPYVLGRPLLDAGTEGSDFTIGSTHHSGAMGNQFVGEIGGLAIFNRQLAPAEINSLSLPRVSHDADRR